MAEQDVEFGVNLPNGIQTQQFLPISSIDSQSLLSVFERISSSTIIGTDSLSVALDEAARR
jgi:hypothetical protein